MNKVKKKLIKFNSGDDIEFNEIDEFDYNHIYSCGRQISSDGSLGWRPQVDMYLSDNILTVFADLAYVKIDEVEIVLKKNSLYITGVREEYPFHKKRHYFKMEIDYGPFKRKINLPVKVREETLKTDYKDGFFVIKLEIEENL